MSYDEGPRGRIDGEGGRADESLGWHPLDLLRRVVARYRRHVRTFAPRLADAHAEAYEK
jgi:hypothetical protein